MSVLRVIIVLFRYISDAFENYFVDYNSKDNETYRSSSYIKKI